MNGGYDSFSIFNLSMVILLNCIFRGVKITYEVPLLTTGGGGGGGDRDSQV